MILDRIQKENDIKKLNKKELKQLKQEIRTFLIESISKTGGHLASNLGVVELTMALHLCFDLPKDKIIWDVGHQAYTHKILTGRKDGFATLRQMNGMSGFPKSVESETDVFNTGHSSTSISAGLGFVAAREITRDNYHVVSVIGDGALTGGMAYEAMNNASSLKGNFIIVLNDNNMSISENVGGMNRYLSKFRTADAYRDLKSGVMTSLKKIPLCGGKIVKSIHNAKDGIKQLFVPGMFFEEMGLMYLGPVDGSNLTQLCEVMNEAKKINGPVLVHVMTKKGSGYLPAERHPSRFHGTDAFEIETGIPKKKKTKASYTDVFATVMVKLAERVPSIVAITAAMSDGTGLKRYRNRFPERFFDVGIAEEHAVTFAAGMAKAGMKPIFAVYSSFLQRAYDQVLHDVCIQNLPVIFAIDRAGLVGSDGETHQGIYDISYLSSIPNMTLLAPKNKWELSDMMKFAVKYQGPIAIRYPRGEAYDGLKEYRTTIEYGKAEVIYYESKVMLWAVGAMMPIAEQVRKNLAEKGIPCTLVNPRFVFPFDKECIDALARTHSLMVTLEDNIVSGGFGEHVTAYVKDSKLDLDVLKIAIPDGYIEHGSVDKLREKYKLDADSVTERILNEVV